MSHLLEVKDLEVKFALRFGDLTAHRRYQLYS